MIHLRFTTTKEAFEFDSPPEEEHPAVLTETCFTMPVFFVVNEVNLLGFPNGATMQLSILGLALSLRNAVARLEPDGQERVLIGSAGTLFSRKWVVA